MNLSQQMEKEHPWPEEQRKELGILVAKVFENLLNVARLSYMKFSCLVQKLDRMKQEGKFTRLTVLIANTNSLQANLTQKFGCEIGIQLEGTNARK